MEFDLVFEGGGAKGSVFVGALQAFEEREHTARRFIGTSAGAITATLMAAGCKSVDLYKAVKTRTSDGKPQFSTFMDVPEKALLEEQGLDKSLTSAILEKAELPWVPKVKPERSLFSDMAASLIDDMAANLIDRPILDLLMTVDAYRQTFSFVERGGLYAGEEFRSWLTGMLDARGAKDPEAPKDPPLGETTLRTFRERTGSHLSLVASDMDSQKMLVLNHRTAPDCPVAWAVRMSMSIPFLWQEVRWKSDWGEYRGEGIEGHAIVDGGVLSNFPIHLLTSKDPEVAAIMGDDDLDAVPNLGLLIDETLEIEGAVETGEKRSAAGKERDLSLDALTRDTVDRIRRLVNAITNTYDAPAIRAHAEEICRLPAKGYGTTEFDMSEERLDALIQAGKKAMEEYLDGLEESSDADP